MTTKEFEQYISTCGKKELTELLAVAYSVMADRATSEIIECMRKEISKGSMKRIIRDLRSIQSSSPRIHEDIEKAISFIRYRLLGKHIRAERRRVYD